MEINRTLNIGLQRKNYCTHHNSPPTTQNCLASYKFYRGLATFSLKIFHPRMFPSPNSGSSAVMIAKALI